jgi:hypothetical protein
MAFTNSGGQATLPCQSWTTHDITSADLTPTGEDWPLAFIIDTTSVVSFRCVQTQATITRTFVGGVIHYVGAFDRVFHAATVATSITIGRP